MLEAKQVGVVATTVGRPPPVHWVIATDGSSAPSSVEALASAGWAFVVQHFCCSARRYARRVRKLNVGVRLW